MSSSIEGYLRELASRLPVPAPRMIDEVRDHLIEAKNEAVARGLGPREAEAEAIASMGPIEDLVAAVKEEGTPHLSPHLVRWVPWLAAFLMLPLLVFVVVNVIESIAGNGGGTGVFAGFEGTFDRWETEIGRLLRLGPFAALLLLVLTRSDLRIAPVAQGFEFSLHARLKGWVLVLAIVASMLAVGVGIYVLNGDACLSDSWVISTFCS